MGSVLETQSDLSWHQTSLFYIRWNSIIFFLLPKRVAKMSINTFYNSQQIFALPILTLVNTTPEYKL